jgi:hypothetical protein
LDTHCHDDDSNRAARLYQRLVSYPTPCDYRSFDFLSYQAPVVSSSRTGEDPELEWAMAVDTIDSIFGGVSDDVIDGNE